MPWVEQLAAGMCVCTMKGLPSAPLICGLYRFQVDELLRHFWALLPVNTTEKEEKVNRIKVRGLNGAAV